MAKKALEQSRRLGSAKIGEAMNLIATANLDLRGVSGLDPQIVVEILVAHFAHRAFSARSGRPEGDGVSPLHTASPGPGTWAGMAGSAHG